MVKDCARPPTCPCASITRAATPLFARSAAQLIPANPPPRMWTISGMRVRGLRVLATGDEPGDSSTLKKRPQRGLPAEEAGAELLSSSAGLRRRRLAVVAARGAATDLEQLEEGLHDRAPDPDAAVGAVGPAHRALDDGEAAPARQD